MTAVAVLTVVKAGQLLCAPSQRPLQLQLCFAAGQAGRVPVAHMLRACLLGRRLAPRCAVVITPAVGVAHLPATHRFDAGALTLALFVQQYAFKSPT